MGLHVKTMGCNGLCRSCYENAIRSVDLDTSYNIDAIIKTIEEETAKIPEKDRTQTVCIHGGEPLALKFEDIERILKRVYELYGYTTIQTNGTLITEKHIELFKKYKCSIGVSLDGDTAQLNYGRWNGGNLTMKQIQKVTDKTLWNMKMCHDAGISLSVIALLRRYNASEKELGGFIRYLLRLRDEFGITSIRTNEVCVYDEKYQEEEQLSTEELSNTFRKLADMCLSEPELQWNPYRDITNMLFGYINDTTCVFTECDVWKTNSERAIDKDGAIGTCLKGGAARDGLQILAADKIERERYAVLLQIPQENGGCKDCRYWFMCKGGCPGEGIDNDWRAKTRFCEAWKVMFAHIEKKVRGLLPNIYTLPMFHPQCPSPGMIQHALGQNGSTWKCNKRRDLEQLKRELEKGGTSGRADAFHGDTAHGDEHGDSGHGDKPHGDSDHGDGDRDDTHGDKYMDSGHKDTFEYIDKSHGDKPHGDRPHGDA